MLDGPCRDASIVMLSYTDGRGSPDTVADAQCCKMSARSIHPSQQPRAASKLKLIRSPFLRQALRFIAPFWRSGPPRAPREEAESRSELFSADQMEQHGKSLATAHKLTSRSGPDQLLPRLAANEAVLIEACNLLTAAVTREPPHHAGGRVAARQLLPHRRADPHGEAAPAARATAASCHAWPSGASAGLPRVYDIALGNDRARRRARRSGKPEPLRGGLSDGHAAQAGRAVGDSDHAAPGADRKPAPRRDRRSHAGRVDRDLADGWADQMMAIAQSDPKSLILVIADMARSNPPMTTRRSCRSSRAACRGTGRRWRCR